MGLSFPEWPKSTAEAHWKESISVKDLFFGSLIPLSVKYNSTMLLPSLYGLGTGLPVILFAILLTVGTRFVGVAFTKVSHIEWWAQRITGGVFIAVGIYYALTYIFGM